MKLKQIFKLSKYSNFNIAALLRSAAMYYSDAGHSETPEESPLWPSRIWPRLSKSKSSETTLRYPEAKAVEQALIDTIRQSVGMLNIDRIKLAKNLGLDIAEPEEVRPLGHIKVYDKRTATKKDKDLHRYPLFLKEDQDRSRHVDPADDPAKFLDDHTMYDVLKNNRMVTTSTRGQKFLKKWEIKQTKKDVPDPA